MYDPPEITSVHDAKPKRLARVHAYAGIHLLFRIQARQEVEYYHQNMGVVNAWRDSAAGFEPVENNVVPEFEPERESGEEKGVPYIVA